MVRGKVRKEVGARSKNMLEVLGKSLGFYLESHRRCFKHRHEITFIFKRSFWVLCGNFTVGGQGWHQGNQLGNYSNNPDEEMVPA